MHYYAAIKRALASQGLTLQSIYEDEGDHVLVDATDNQGLSITALVSIERDTFDGCYFAEVVEIL